MLAKFIALTIFNISRWNIKIEQTFNEQQGISDNIYYKEPAITEKQKLSVSVSFPSDEECETFVAINVSFPEKLGAKFLYAYHLYSHRIKRLSNLWLYSCCSMEYGTKIERSKHFRCVRSLKVWVKKEAINRLLCWIFYLLEIGRVFFVSYRRIY